MKRRITKMLCAVSLSAGALLLMGLSFIPDIAEIRLPSETVMEKGGAESLAVEYIAANKNVSDESIALAAEKLSLTWVSSNENIITVDKNGLVEAHRAGEADISVYATGSDLSANCRVEVEVPAVNIRVPERMTLVINGVDSLDLNAAVEPADATNVKVTYHSSDEAIAVVDEKGSVRGLSNGQCVVTTKVWDTDEPEEKPVLLGSTIVTVRTAPTELSLPGASLYKGNSAQLNVVIKTEGVNIGDEFTWTSSDESVVTVDETGMLKGIAAGSATITATNEFGLSAESTVTVKENPVTEIGAAYVEAKKTSVQPTASSKISSSAKPVITGTAPFSKYAPKKTSPGSGTEEIGVFRYDPLGINLSIIWDGSQSVTDHPQKGFATSGGGIPGDLDRCVIIGDHNYQSGAALAYNLQAGDRVTFDTAYGQFVYEYVGSKLGRYVSYDSYLKFPKSFTQKYNLVYTCTAVDLKTDAGEYLFKNSSQGAEECRGKLYFVTCYPLNGGNGNQRLFMEFNMVSGVELVD